MTLSARNLTYYCERGHETIVSDEWYGEGMKPVPPPKQLGCWEPWEDDMCGAFARRKLAYHGTPHIEKVLREGLLARYAVDGGGNTGTCSHIWLARTPEDAAASGDVIEVDMAGISGDFEEEAWQGCYHGGDLGPERLRAYRKQVRDD